MTCGTFHVWTRTGTAPISQGEPCDCGVQRWPDDDLLDGEAAAEQRGYARGRAEVLRQVATLPGFAQQFGLHTTIYSGPRGSVDTWSCFWCGYESSNGLVPHPDNGCLWPQAQAAAKETP